jgi:receptor expression-enhancing protein 5/6
MAGLALALFASPLRRAAALAALGAAATSAYFRLRERRLAERRARGDAGGEGEAEAITAEDAVRASFSELRDLVEVRTGLPRKAASGLTVVCVLLAFSGLRADPFVSVAAVAYPAYASFKALRSPQRDDDAEWLTYWIVYAALSCAEALSGRTLQWLPGYSLAKLALLLWCFLPATRGARVIYARALEPLLLRYEADIDREAARLAERARGAISAAGLQQAAAAAAAGAVAAAAAATDAAAHK